MSSQPDPEEAELRITSRAATRISSSLIRFTCRLVKRNCAASVNSKAAAALWLSLPRWIVRDDLLRWIAKRSSSRWPTTCAVDEQGVEVIRRGDVDLGTPSRGSSIPLGGSSTGSQSWETVARIEVDVNHRLLAEISARAKELLGPSP